MINLATQGTSIYERRCKVCNSQFKNLIEDLSIKGLNPRQIMDYLRSSKDPLQLQILEEEDLTEHTIRRHLDKHFSIQTGAAIKVAETKRRIEKSRESYKQGVHMVVDSVATIAHMIDLALINMEDLDNLEDVRQKHQLTINYMATIKGLVEEFAKLTGELKTEGTIDINFFSNQITEFANIIMTTIHKLDEQMGLNHQLEYNFGREFKKQWDLYKDTQKKILNGELPVNYGERERNINTFNDEH